MHFGHVLAGGALLVGMCSGVAAEPAPAVNVALSARVLTWDADRKTGCSNGRLDEFPAEELYLEEDVVPRKDRSYVVPVKNGKGCIGLEWLECRRINEIGIQFSGAESVRMDGVLVEYWVLGKTGTYSAGGSKWQGGWESLPGKITQDGNRWTYTVDREKTDASGTLKVRWVFPNPSKPIIVKRMWAFTDSQWADADLTLLLDGAKARQKARVQIYNGVIVDKEGRESTGARWNACEPLHLRVRYCTTTSWMTDRTILRLTVPGGACGVAVDDVLAHGCVYVKDYGIFVASDAAKISLADYKKKIAAKQTILDRVHQMPDQTYQQAIEHITRPDAHLGPTMISLACDNHKFVVSRDGTIDWDTDPKVIDDWSGWPPHDPVGYHLKVQFGKGTGQDISRHLQDGWLPIPITTTNDAGVSYRQRTFVTPYDKTPLPADAPVWMNRKPLCVSEFTITNTGSQPADVSLRFSVVCDADKGALAKVTASSTGALIEQNDKVLAALDLSQSHVLSTETGDGVCTVSGSVPAGQKAVCLVYIPGWDASGSELGQIRDVDSLAAATVSHWKEVMRSSMHVDIPDAELGNAIMASQVHCYLAARNEDHKYVSPWIAAMIYGPFESEAQAVISGMEFTNNMDFARRGLEYFIKRYNKQGFLTTGYTVMGTGWHLWTLGEYYQLTKDREWLKTNADEIARVCRWVMAQREKTKRIDAFGKKVPEWGLMPPGVTCDWEVFSFYMALNSFYYAGLNAAGRALDEIGYPGAKDMIASAAELKRCTLRAFHWTQSLAPVYPLQDGTWVPSYPTHVYCPSPIDNYYNGEDYGRTSGYDVELGACHMISQGVMDPKSRDAGWIMNSLEDDHFLRAGWIWGGVAYPLEKVREDWFNLGGFARIQPHYARTAEIYALRDDTKAFLRTYFNTIAAYLNREDLSLWEHFGNGVFSKTHETSYFLYRSRTMLITERGDELWLAPFVTNNWFKDGEKVAVDNAPSRWGDVSYKISSHVNLGYIEAVVFPPSRELPKQIVLRLRHPEGKRIRAVSINGRVSRDFDPAREIVTIKPGREAIGVRVSY